MFFMFYFYCSVSVYDCPSLVSLYMERVKDVNSEVRVPTDQHSIYSKVMHELLKVFPTTGEFIFM